MQNEQQRAQRHQKQLRQVEKQIRADIFSHYSQGGGNAQKT